MPLREAIAIILGAVAIGVAAAFFVGRDADHPANKADARPSSKLEIVYFGARQCGPCRHWREEIYPEWRNNPLRNELRVTIVEAATVRAVASGQVPRYRWAIDELRANGEFRGTPTFAVIRDRKILKAYAGVAGWERSIRYAKRRV